jgi:hypothetical protein
MTCRCGGGGGCRRKDCRLSTVERKDVAVRNTCICVVVFGGVVLCGLLSLGAAIAEEGTLPHKGPALTPGFSAKAEVQLARDSHRDVKHYRKDYEPEEDGRSRRSDERRRIRSVVCKSEGYQYNHCPMNRQGRKVRLVRQLSDTRCVRGDNWGTNRNGIWVDRGCGGKFRLE